MKHVVFFGCDSSELASLLEDIDFSEYRATAFNSTDHDEGKNFIAPPSVAVVEAGCMTDKLTFHEMAQKVLATADVVVVQREPMITFLVEVYEYIGKNARAHLPSLESLRNASNKNLMREAFMKGCPEYSVGFVSINCATDDVALKIREAALTYPVMLKPANEMSSLFVERYDSESELITAAQQLADLLVERYKLKNRSYDPYMVAEEYIDGDMYTIASWVNSAGDFYHFPLIRVLNAKDIGREGYHLFSRYTLDVDESMQQQAQMAAQAAATALGLRASSLHVELMLTQTGFKVIELGARVGGFRQWLYKTTYGLNCFKNDFAVRAGDDVVTKADKAQFASVIHIFAKDAGIITAISGEDKLASLASYQKHKLTKGIGDKSGSVAKGVMAIGVIYLANSSIEQLCRDIDACRDLPEISVRPIL